MIEYGGNITREMALRDLYERSFLRTSKLYGYTVVSDDGGNSFVQVENQKDFLILMEILVKSHFKLENLSLQFGTVDNPSCIRVSITAPENIKS